MQRPTVIGLIAFALLVVLTASVLVYRLTASDSRFVSVYAPPSPSPTPSVTPTIEETVTLSGVGDIVMGSATIALPPNGAAGFFDGVTDALNADVVTGNFEGTLTEETGHQKCPPDPTPSPEQSPEVSPPPEASPSPEPRQTCFAYRMPPSYAQHLAAAGFDVLNLANNHTNDYGSTGLRNTQQALHGAGVDYTGMPGQFAVREVNGFTVAILGFGPYGWMQRVTDIPRARQLVERASQQADVVMVHMQAGAEGADKQHVSPGVERYLEENRGDVMAFSRAVIDSGADVVVGHGPHVLRGAEWYKGRLIAYSMGNFAGYRTLSRSGPSGTGGVLKVTLRKDGTFVSGAVVPTRMVAPGLPALDPEGSAITQVNQLSAQDFPSTAVRLEEDGTIIAQERLLRGKSYR